MRPAKRRFASNPVVPKLCLGMRPREALLRNLNPRRNLAIILKRKLPRRSEITSPTGTLHPRESRGMENRKQINCHPLSFPSSAWECVPAKLCFAT